MLLKHAPVTDASAHDTGRALLKKMYEQCFQKAMPEILKGKRGKPYFADGSAHFSITHTCSHVFCVLSDAPVGIDAEEMDRDINLRLAQKILSPEEKQRYEASPNPRDTLLRFWVLKEAAGKCSGEGINGYPNHTDFHPDDPRIQICHGCYVAVITEE